MQALVLNELRRLDPSYMPNAGPAMKRYQDAFGRLSVFGPDAVNRVIRRAVLGALRNPPDASDREALETGDFERCKALDEDGDRWVLGPGVASLGALVAEYPQKFGQVLLTSNFDPLIEISVRRAQGQCWTTPSQGNFPLETTYGPGCNVVHLHGYWASSDTFHHPSQIGEARPALEGSIASLLREKIFVVAAYGGWDDVFMRAVQKIAPEQRSSPEILWTFLEHPEPGLANHDHRWPSDLVTRNRIQFFGGVDVHSFFPRLLAAMREILPARGNRHRARPWPPRPTGGQRQHLAVAPAPLPALPVDEADSRALPLDLGSAWGLDRGAFTGVLVGRPDDPSYRTLVGTEEALAQARGQNQAMSGLPARRWIYLNVSASSPPETLEEVCSAASQDDPASGPAQADLLQPGLGNGLLTGVFCEVPVLEVGGGDAAPICRAWSQALARLFAPRVPALVFHLTGQRDAATAARQLAQSLGGAQHPFAACRLLVRERPVPPLPEPAVTALASSVASRLGDLAERAGLTGTNRHGAAATAWTVAADLVRRLDQSPDALPPGTDRALLDWAATTTPETLEPLLRAYAASTRRQARRESLVWAARADDWMDAWLDGAALREPGAIAELVAVADPQNGAVADDLAVALLRRIRHSPDRTDCAALMNRLNGQLSPELRAVNRLRIDETPAAADLFLAESGPRAFGLAMRAGFVPWPSRELLRRADLEHVGLWQLVSALPLNRERIADLLTLGEPAYRSVFGLCTATEARRVQADPDLLRLVVEARRGRPFGLSEGG
jgi:hypothetical protein